MSIRELQHQLQSARHRMRIIPLAERPANEDLREEILSLERRIAALQRQEYASPWTWPEPWAFSRIQTPVLLSNGLLSILVYESLDLREPNNVRRQPTASRFAMVEFWRCSAVYLGSPNDEAIEGHRLYGKGIDVGGAFTIENSLWREELARINSVHSQFDAAYWQSLTHYLLFFKDHTFECLAREVKSEIISGTITDVGSVAIQRMTRIPLF